MVPTVQKRGPARTKGVQIASTVPAFSGSLGRGLLKMNQLQTSAPFLRSPEPRQGEGASRQASPPHHPGHSMMNPHHSNPMKTTTSLLTAFSLFAFASCDSKKENMREDALENKADTMEDKADAVRKGSENAADNLEDKADAVRDAGAGETRADGVEDAADAVREAGERRADQLEEKADGTREQK